MRKVINQLNLLFEGSEEMFIQLFVYRDFHIYLKEYDSLTMLDHILNNIQGEGFR